MLEYVKFIISFLKGILFGNSSIISSIPVKSLPEIKNPEKNLMTKEFPEMKPTSSPLVYFKDVVDRYGVPYDITTQKQDENIKNKWEQKWMTLWRWDNFEQFMSLNSSIKPPVNPPFKRIYCNKELIPYLNLTFKILIEKDLFKEIKTFDGCWNVRHIRGTTDRWSTHTFGIAVDFNAEENPLGGPVRFSQDFLQIWRDSGWTIGADFSRKDGMHFQLVSKA